METREDNLMKKSIFASALLVCLFAFCASNAQAELIIINITATVDIVNDFGNYLEGKIHVGDTITGSYTYESTTWDSNPSSTIGDYEHYSAPAGISLSVGGFNFKTDPAAVNFLVEITNDYPPNDDYFLLSSNNLPLSNGTLVESISWWLSDSTGAALLSDALLVTAPVLSRWQINQLDMGYSGAYLVRSQVTSAILIPEPCTMLLLSLGTILLIKRYS